jgi:carbamoyl-phosphate synthase small subunit
VPRQVPAIVALVGGTVFRGISVGAEGASAGEVVFNTAITGYQEILTDPSYCRKIVTLTYPHIGNYGINPEDVESGRVYAAGLVIRDLPLPHWNWPAAEDLISFLRREDRLARPEPSLSPHRRRASRSAFASVASCRRSDPALFVRFALTFPCARGQNRGHRRRHR